METPKLKLLSRAMQAYTWRMQALAGNIANLDTPGYDRIAVSFEETLQEMRHQVPSLRDVTDVEPRVSVEERPPVLEEEMMELADTQMRTQFATRALHDHFGMLRMGITGRTG
ncbi:flagellar basal body protein [Rhodocaloribacter litoris]|uniref:flagellar basal body rod protein FlgB n=1 Tax=Rhodocaloribacter litoris TaxID=2558931 RepID=UPI00141F2681|nr:flagellar basal body protein [Rhodocaloribacter litoris]QXD16036.1 flagellar basal body protein [Rhodocaloribacter litoris]GIV59764.1 MAG: flagellar biosynthesis protein FlgB [Rhodothermaceae bacterium]